MGKFRYTAVDAAGKQSKGIIEASDPKAAAEVLRSQHYFLLRADAIGEGKSFRDYLRFDFALERGLSKTAIAQLTRELAIMLQAGQDIDHALRFLADTAASSRSRAILQTLRDEVRGGKTFASALSDSSAGFSRLYIGLVRAGETSGRIADALSHLADLLDREAKLQASIQSALTYPALLLFASIGTIVMLVTYVLPQFTPIFAQAGAQLPAATRMLIGAGDFLRDYGTVLLAVALAGFLAAYRVLRDPAIRLAAERIVLHIPIAGFLVRRAQAARFTRTLGTLLRDGVPLISALGISHGVLGNLVAAKIVETALVQVKSGARLAASLASGGFFPAQTIHLLQLGEETGRLAVMSLRAADIHDDQVHNSVTRMVSLLVPGVTIVMGLIVAGIVGSLLVAMLSLNDLAL